MFADCYRGQPLAQLLLEKGYSGEIIRTVNLFFAYDSLDRLTRADYYYPDGSEDEQFIYDDLGNRLTLNNRDGCDVAYTHNMTNEYTAIGGSSPGYDFAGNMTTDAAGYVYYYDYENRLTKITDAEPCDVAVYSYDALGRRIEKITYDPCGVADTTTRYYYDGWRVLAETDGDGVRQREYAYGNYIDETLIMTDNRSGEAEDDHYYLHDHLFSPVALVDEDGSVLERYEYDAYGGLIRLDPDFTTWSGTPAGNPCFFTGQRLDNAINSTEAKITQEQGP